MDANSAALYSRFTSLKSNQNGLQTWISVGGWSFTDPGPSQKAFSNMTSSEGNRAKFISGLKQFMSTYGFDGVDLDWEYPGADDRGGRMEDRANYVSLAQELKAAFGSKYGISMTLPISYWYLQHFDLSGIQQHIDWFNLMAYDLHGTWDAASMFFGPYIAPHTNLTEIDLGMDLLWRSGVTPDRVVLGQSLYGRSFTLANSSCNTPNGVCKFSGPANAGPCSIAPGILDKQEIDDIISKNHLQPVWAGREAVKWITWNSNQWVSYDDADTFRQKKDFANSRCLGGLLVWAMDQVDQAGSNDLGLNNNVTPDQQSDADQKSADQLAGIICRSASCGSDCPQGSSQVTETNGQPEVTTNKNSHGKEGDRTCNGGVQSYCCAGFKPAPSKNQLAKQAKDAAGAAAQSVAAQASLDLAAKAFCRVAVPALLAPLELVEGLIPIVGEIADLIEIAATPAIIKACVKGIEKEGKAEFKVFGKKHTLSMNQPTTKPTATRPPPKSHETPKSSTENKCNLKARGVERRAPCNNDKTEYTATTTLYQTIQKVCDVGKYGQACFHYRSAIREANDPRFNPVTCSEFVPSRKFMAAGPALAEWSGQHNADWGRWMRRPKGRCQRDEWPPQHFWQGDPGQLIRYNHLEDNTGAGSIWNRFCPEHAAFGCVPGSERVLPKGPKARIATTECKKELTIKVMSLSFDTDDAPMAQEKDDGLSANECYPQMLVNDPSFALVNRDPYFKRNNRAPNLDFAYPPSAQLINNRKPPFRKREITYLNSTEFVFRGFNYSRHLNSGEMDHFANAALDEHLRMLDEQMEEAAAYFDCIGDDCATSATLLPHALMTLSSKPTGAVSERDE
ncbi:hypothetical protein G7Y79_00075g098980 [Physcia stellaris]|nr:hypothetical protein G7Y79_00075g098980 [Physcia stellaris]